MAAVAKKVVEVVLPKWDETDDGYLTTATFGDMEVDFASAVKRIEELKEQKGAMESEELMLKEALLIASYSITAEDGVDVSDLTGISGSKFVRRFGTSPSKLDAQKLVTLGVTMDVINRATTPGKAYDFIQVVVPKAKDRV